MRETFTDRYGAIPLDRYDVRGVSVVSLDLRVETGAAIGTLDETKEYSSHPFTLSVFGRVPEDDGPPVAEIRCLIDGVEVSIVGALTGRIGVREITPDHVLACRDPAYQQLISAWLGMGIA